ncbi:hypothetical protein [Niveispirillum fermenti]|uniref:hypothetical protein n=1 Tax=Niveispirillum fermenti TaxID=1233113 RepID=UPI003A861C7B
MSDAIRQIRARARRKAAGLVRLEFWVPASRREEVRTAVQALLESPPPAATEEPAVPVVQRRRRLMTDIDGLLD